MDNVDSNIKTPETPTVPETHLSNLKIQADSIGLKYHPKISAVKLQKKIDVFLARQAVDETTVAATPTPKITEIPASETRHARHARLRREASQLIRVRVHCLNPTKRKWPGEVLSVGNDVLGTFKKYVPFNLEVGYHIPMAIYNMLLCREFQTFYMVKGKNGMPDSKRGKLVKEFNVEVLPPLTNQELKDLAHEQSINRSIE